MSRIALLVSVIALAAVVVVAVSHAGGSEAAKPGEPRLIELGTQTLPPGLTSFVSSMVDVADCDDLELMASGPLSFEFTDAVIRWTSPDGATPIMMPDAAGHSTWGPEGAMFFATFEGGVPFLKIDLPIYPHDATREVSVWLWCTP